MAYSELIKNFERIRDYMRQFYVYGFKSRADYDVKSSRSYDNEKRRIESWLGEYMSFRNDENGKAVFLSVDSRAIKHNPLHQAFKTKSFTPADITLHFYILDILCDGTKYTTKEIADIIAEEYFSNFEKTFELDESTVRKKLKEYAELGVIKAEKEGKEVFYRIINGSVNIEKWKNAVDFYSEADPMGVIGSYFIDDDDTPFSFKHHYILHALDSQILYDILLAMNNKNCIEITVNGKKDKNEKQFKVYPVQIYISTQTGREYLLAYDFHFKKPLFYRLDTIHDVKEKDSVENEDMILEKCERFKQYLWGVSSGSAKNVDHIEMDIYAGESEEHIVKRLEREKRNGKVEKIADNTYKFSDDVYDASEMLPWIRTFIGRIERLECTNSFITETFYADLKEMTDMYGGEENALS